jgi:hypothetical protein
MKYETFPIGNDRYAVRCSVTKKSVTEDMSLKMAEQLAIQLETNHAGRGRE